MGKATKKKKWAEEEKDEQYKKDLKNKTFSKKETSYKKSYKNKKIKIKKKKEEKPFYCPLKYDCMNRKIDMVNEKIKCINYLKGILDDCLMFKPKQLITKTPKDHIEEILESHKEILSNIEKKIEIAKKENKIILSFKRNIEME